METRRFGAIGAMLLGLGALAVLPACRPSGEDSANGPEPSRRSGRTNAAVQALLAQHRGKVLVLLLGREDCPGTAKATAVLDAYASRKPADVALLRLEVPLPGETLQAGAWSHGFPRQLDAGRAIADGLGFFYYPTLYVFDREGELRFTGGYDAQRLERMVREIAEEQPGQPKKLYTLAMPPAGSLAPPFAARTLTGREAALATLRGKRATMLVFARASCPFSRQALPAIQQLADAHRSQGIAVALINQGEERERILPVYEQAAPGLPVVWDATGEISNAYGVDTVPFFFLLDGDGVIVQRRSFTLPAASSALDAILGKATAAPRYKANAAG
ncbi:MAG TPA: TlpA disulfide reductase family protein [Planctomycetota bacterium]|nr:TlpA disulfide reductase family protein [Planctomycetota bacterium]HRR82443.1 TlpA disulfide reductase family protein [Planctomycetota bacterium]HRT95713.1 TlpA disulfide reductase family protein [Planctomycetota bacterium]